MTYMALYRQWRPQRFADVVGQQHITRTLRNAVTHDKLAHAYLFCGPRGTGKTTIAKLLAKAVNCPQQAEGEPCNECELCRQITEGRSVDVLEIDAASNRGIDEIRDLKEKVHYTPVDCRRKVYIIDEVHMLTNEAFNALLKTLEEPPSHVLFLLATTDPQKVPLTILSRCQRFDFHRFADEQIIERLRLVAEAREVRIAEAGLAAIARAAEGGMRDALSLLDQVMSFSSDDIELDDVLAVLGAAPLQVHLELARHLARRDAPAALAVVAQTVQAGQDLRQFLRDLMACLRHLLLIGMGTTAEQSGFTPDEWQALQQVAALFQPGQLTQLLRHLAEAENDMRWSSQPRLFLELALVRSLTEPGQPTAAVAAPATASTTAPVAATAPATVPAAAPAAAPTTQPAAAAPARPPRKVAAAPPVAADETPTAALDLAAVRERWGEVLETIKQANPATEALLREGQPTAVNDRQIVVEFPAKFQFHRERVARPRERQLIEAVLCRLFGPDCTIHVQAAAAAATTPTAADEALQHPVVQRLVDLLDGEIVEIKGLDTARGDDA